MLQSLNPYDLSSEIENLYSSGLPKGTQTGWDNVDELYSVAPGQWTVVTGVPGHGKSSWLDCLMLRLIERGWKFIVYTPENQPHHLYLANLCEKLLGKPFREGYNGRMSEDDMWHAIKFLEPNLRILKHDGGQNMPNISSFMQMCETKIREWGGDFPIGVIIDPINELSSSQVTGMSETQQINKDLMIYRQWIRKMERVHGFIVAHPTKIQKDKDGNFKEATLYDINGSAAWKNKADCGIIVIRKEDRTIVRVEKIRFRHIGRIGDAELVFNSGNGTFRDY